MDRHAEARDLGDLRGIEIRGIVGAVRHEHHGGDGPRLSAAQHVQQRVADVRDGARRRHLLERAQLDDVAGERKQIDGEIAFEGRQRAFRQAVDGLLQPRRVLVAVEHAARGVEQHGDRVLLRPQRLGYERRPPGQHQQRGDERRLQCAEHRRAHDAKAGSPTPDRDTDRDGRGGHEREQQPHGPAAREHELGTFIGGARVFEEELEHSGSPYAGGSRTRRPLDKTPETGSNPGRLANRQGLAGAYRVVSARD
jgi:hypothetical protein